MFEARLCGMADLDATIRALEEQVAKESVDLEKQRELRAQKLAGGPARDPDAASKPPPRFEKDADERSVFVTGLPKTANVTPEAVAAFFGDCGTVKTCTLLKNKQTGELKGSAYVEFATHEGAGRAIDTKNNTVIEGATLTVTKKRSLFDPSRGRGTDRGRGRGRGRGGAPDPTEMMTQFMGAMMGAMGAMTGRGGGRGRGRGFGRGRAGGGGAMPFQ